MMRHPAGRVCSQASKLARVVSASRPFSLLSPGSSRSSAVLCSAGRLREEPNSSRRNFSSKKVPASVDVAIIGGGVTGASLHYHLEKLGFKAAMFEKAELTSGATWHAAGLTTYFHGGNNFRLWHDYSVNLFKEWQKDGTIHSFHTPGSMRLVEKGNRDRLDEARHHEVGSRSGGRGERRGRGGKSGAAPCPRVVQ